MLAAALALPVSAYDCVELKCTEMTTCAEAHYKFAVCGHTKRDADHDGIPCEDLCGKDLEKYHARVQAQQEKGAEEVAPPTAASALPALISPAEAATERSQGERFTCSDKRTCGQMLSCDEAKFYLSKCGVKSLDRDHDGIPCNSLCRNR